MQKWKIFSLSICALLWVGCGQDPSKDSSVNSRTMIIGGVPVHDHDYKRPKANTEPKAQTQKIP